MEQVPPDVGQLHGRMKQIADANHWTETDSPALAAVGALARGESLAPTMQAAAIADAERYAATAGAQLGFSEMGMEALRNTLSAETGVAKPMDGLSTAGAVQHVAKKFASRLKIAQEEEYAEDPEPLEGGHKHNTPNNADSAMHGDAIHECFEAKDGSLWCHNNEYATRVDFCPFCGIAAKNKIGETTHEPEENLEEDWARTVEENY